MSQTQWPRGLRRGYLAARLLGLWVRIPPGHGYLSVSCEFCVFSRRGLCDGLITGPQESYRVRGCVCDREELAQLELMRLGGEVGWGESVINCPWLPDVTSQPTLIFRK